MMHRPANQDAVERKRRPRAWLELALVPVPAAGAGWLISAAGQTAYRDGLAGLYSGTDFSLFVAAVCITWAFLVAVGVRLLVQWRRLTLGGRAVRVVLALAGLAGAITAGDYARDTYPVAESCFSCRFDVQNRPHRRSAHPGGLENSAR